MSRNQQKRDDEFALDHFERSRTTLTFRIRFVPNDEETIIRGVSERQRVFEKISNPRHLPPLDHSMDRIGSCYTTVFCVFDWCFGIQRNFFDSSD